MSESRLSGLIVARFAQDYDLTGTEAWRLFKTAGAEFRKVMVDHYSTSERGRDIARWIESPEDLAIDNLSVEIDVARARPTRGQSSGSTKRSRGLGEDVQLPPAEDLDSLYTDDDPYRGPR